MADADNRKLIAVAAAIDIVSVVVFVAIGRKNHDESGSMVAGTLKVAAPFLIALVVGWLAARAWQAPTAVRTGVIAWLVTVIGGMLLRKFAFDRGTAVPFIIVASLFILLFVVGWRVLAEWRNSRGAAAV
jgi:uncharacterized membrane protein YbjE (DUF340 family)